MTNSSDQPVIRASEIGEYVYCARAWWLHRVQGVQSANVAAMRSGQEAHDQHGGTVSRSLAQRRIALYLAAAGGLLALFALLLALVGGGG